ncbi:MAG: hypothetical protein ABEH88_04410 [Halobacteriales archaeon]
MATCDQCGAFVSKDFLRVFGTNDGIVQGCLDCTRRTGLSTAGISGHDN